MNKEALFPNVSRDRTEGANNATHRALREFAFRAREPLLPLGLHVTGVLYCAVPNAREGGLTIGASLLVVPNETSLHYHTIDFARRAQTVYEKTNLSDIIKDLRIPASYVDLVYHVDPSHPIHQESDPGLPNYERSQIRDIHRLEKKGIIQPEGELARICNHYGISEVTEMDGHFVSPDPFPIALISLAVAKGNVKNMLEIGGGVSPITDVALDNGINVTVVDNSQSVIDRLRLRHGNDPLLTTILGDAFAFLAELPEGQTFDVINCGLPYEFNPDIIDAFGSQLAGRTKFLIVQSGIPGLGQMEHDILMGKEYVRAHPWYRQNMSVTAHFSNVREAMHSYQLGILASNNQDDFASLMEDMKQSDQFLIPPPLRTIALSD